MAKKIAGQAGRQGGRDSKGGDPRGWGPEKGAPQGTLRLGLAGTPRIGELGHVGAGGHVRPEGVGVT